ncbi:MAG TPA: hypothetical protein RMH99_16090 [Sandaracinaceae bacterium LLY-WYZ-13_1]|nr:hypothetical protein [Sandaracinaceae bacterium LLY-WYZ-13_1]
MKRLSILLFALASCASAGCVTQHEVTIEPVRLEPIEVRMDVHVRVDEADAEAGEPETGDEPETPDAPSP